MKNRSPAENTILLLAISLYLTIASIGFFHVSTSCSLSAIARYENDPHSSNDPKNESCWNEQRWWESKFFTEINVADACLAVFTGVLVIVSWWQGVHLQNHVKFLREEFVSTHRPKIIVRDFHISGQVQENTAITIGFLYVNIGETVAKNIRISYEIIPRQDSEDIIGHPSVRTIQAPDTTLVCGAIGRAALPSNIIFSRDNVGHLASGWLEIVCRGTVVYEDERGTIRRTGFARVCGNAQGRFALIDDPEREYTY
jgi:hypothetical protein